MNKKILPILLAIISIVLTVDVDAKPIEIIGHLTNSSQYKYAYLMEYYGSELTKKDSAKIDNGNFTFKSKQSFPRGFYQIKFNDQAFLNIILSNENVDIKADLNNLNSSLVVSNSKENDIYRSYKEFTEGHNSSIKALQGEVSQVMSLQNSDPPAFEAKMAKLKSKYDSLTGIQQTFYKGLADNNKDLFVSKFVRSFVIEPTHTKDNFINPSDFSDTELLRGDVLISKINLFYQQFVERSLEAWQEEAQKLITKTEGAKGQELVFIALLNIFSSADADYTAGLAAKYAKAFPKSKKAKSILASMPKTSPQVGELAPNINLPSPDGKNISLTSLKGKIVLLDFWASWCGPCRMENPNVVNVYNKFKDKGFIIYSVSLDSDKNKWLQAIEKDQLTWIHVSDLKNWKSEGAQLYGVQSIPATYLIDKNGKIIAKNLRGVKLEEELKKIFDIN